MSRWDCPECGGGFPEPRSGVDLHKNSIVETCPWCGEELKGDGRV